MTHHIDRAIGISKLTDGEPEPDALVDAARRGASALVR